MNSYIKYKILLTECRLLNVTYLYQNNNPNTECKAIQEQNISSKARTSSTNSNTALLTTNSQSNYIQLYTALA